MGLSILADDSLQIDIGSAGRGNTLIEARGRLAPGRANLVGFERPLDDIGNGAIFAPGEPACEIACSGAAYGELRFGHDILLFRLVEPYHRRLLLARWQLVACRQAGRCGSFAPPRAFMPCNPPRQIPLAESSLGISPQKP